MATRSSLRTDAWDLVYAVLQGTTVITGISTNNIHSSLNGKLIKDEGYPQVIIFPPSSSFEKTSVNGEYTESDVAILIEVYHTGNRTCKTLVDEITAQLLTYRSTFSGERLMNMKIDDGSYDTWEEGNKKIHRIGFTLSFRFISD